MLPADRADLLDMLCVLRQWCELSGTQIHPDKCGWQRWRRGAAPTESGEAVHFFGKELDVGEGGPGAELLAEDHRLDGFADTCHEDRGPASRGLLDRPEPPRQAAARVLPPALHQVAELDECNI